MKWLLLLWASCLFVTSATAQHRLTLRVVDSTTNLALTGVNVQADRSVTQASDSNGQVGFSLGEGTHTLTVSSAGYRQKVVTVGLPITTEVIIRLVPDSRDLQAVVVISSTRTNQRIENSPLNVEVLGREEMDEENTIKPANIASILGDVSGVQIQQSSAVSGNANVRIQGLEGRYTQVLRDGAPLFDGFSGGFGILSIPPLDLKQVELIKGSASTLYGGGAIGGLVNLISRTPTTRQEGVVTLNQSTLKESNLNTFFSKRANKIGYTFFGGYTRQRAVDVNKDEFSDVPHLDALVIHPRLFFYPDAQTTLITGYTGTFEDRKGGDMAVLKGKADAVHQYYEQNKTARHSGELALERRISGNQRLALRGSLSAFDRTIQTAQHFFKGRQLNYFSEVSYLVPYGKNSIVGGVNVVGDRFSKRPSDPVLLTNFDNNTVGVFVQGTWTLKEKTVLEAGLRDDHHPTYGNFFLPRLALFQRFNEQWASRFGVGLGYKTPNPLVQQTVDAAIETIQPLPAGIRAERSVGYNAEVNYKTDWSEGNELFINHAFFLTRITKPVLGTEQPDGTVLFSNAARPVVTRGFDTYVKAVIQEWEIYAGYTYTIAERKFNPQQSFIPLTPRHRAAFTLVRDFEEEGWRVGLEGSYNGRQYRLNGSQTPDYLFAAAMVEKKFGRRISAVLNGENLLDYRQSRHEPVYTGSITDPVFEPLWAPIDGIVINLSVKFNLFPAARQ